MGSGSRSTTVSARSPVHTNLRYANSLMIDGIPSSTRRTSDSSSAGSSRARTGTRTSTSLGDAAGMPQRRIVSRSSSAFFSDHEKLYPDWAGDEHTRPPTFRDGSELLQHRKGVLASKHLFGSLERVTFVDTYPRVNLPQRPDLRLFSHGDQLARLEVLTHHRNTDTWESKFEQWRAEAAGPTIWVFENRKHVIRFWNHFIDQGLIETDGGRFGGKVNNWSPLRVNDRLRRSREGLQITSRTTSSGLFQACSAAAESMRSSYSRTIISSFDHNQIPAPKWGLTIPIPYNNLERTPPRNGEWGRHANRGVHGGVRVYEGFLIGVYGAAARQNCSYTPNYNNSDVSMGPISSCQQSPRRLTTRPPPLVYRRHRCGDDRFTTLSGDAPPNLQSKILTVSSFRTSLASRSSWKTSTAIARVPGDMSPDFHASQRLERWV